MQRLHRDVRRPTVVPLQLPFGVRTVGHYRFAPGQHSMKYRLTYVQILWGIRGVGAAEAGSGQKRLPPDTVYLLLPSMRHSYYALAEPWELRYLTLDGLSAADLVQGFGFPVGEPFPAGPCPAKLFDRLEGHAKEKGFRAQKEAALLAFEILGTMADVLRQSHYASERQKFLEASIECIHAALSDPGAGVEQIAARMGETRFHFCRKFQEALGCSPSEYIRAAKLQRATSLLSRAEPALNDIAAQCGFTSVRSFSRFFARQTGNPPTRYRASLRDGTVPRPK